MGFRRHLKKAVATIKRPLSANLTPKKCTIKAKDEAELNEQLLQHMVQLSLRDMYEMVRQALQMRIEIHRHISEENLTSESSQSNPTAPSLSPSTVNQKTNSSSDLSIEELLLKSFTLPVDCIKAIEKGIPPSDPTSQNELGINKIYPALRVRIPERSSSMKNHHCAKEVEHRTPPTTIDPVRQNEQDISILEHDLRVRNDEENSSMSRQPNEATCLNGSPNPNGSPRLVGSASLNGIDLSLRSVTPTSPHTSRLSTQSISIPRQRCSHSAAHTRPRWFSEHSIKSSRPTRRSRQMSKLSVRSQSSKSSSKGSLRRNSVAAYNLLGRIFPSETLPKLKWEMGDSIAKHHPSVSVFFSDIVGFTDWCATKSPNTVIECLSAYFQILDDLAEEFGVYKVETVGDAWMGVCGAPRAELHHADIMGNFAVQVLETLEDLKAIFQSSSISLRVGLHCGPVVCGVVRTDRPRWQLFGDTVNMASRMESTSIPGHIQISQDMYDALSSSPRTIFTCVARGSTEIKGKGSQDTFFLTALETNILNNTNPRQSTASRLTIFNPSMTVPDLRTKSLSALVPVQSPRVSTPHTISNPNEFNSLFQPESTNESINLTLLRKRLSLFSASDPSSPAAQDCVETNKYLEQKSILVVDDMPSILMQFRRVLKKTGLTVYTTLNGQEALALLKEREYVVAFIDINMPLMDGYQCVKEFREWECDNREFAQPIIAISIDGSVGDQDLCARGFSGFNQKNANKNTILDQVSHWLLLE